MSRCAWLLSIMVVLAGCEGSQVESNSKPPTSSASSTPVTQVKAESEADSSQYATNVSPRLKAFVESLMDLTGGTGDLSVPVPGTDADAKAAIAKSVEQMASNVRKKGEVIKDLTPPEEMKAFHGAVIAMVNDANTRWDEAVERANGGDMQAGIQAVEDMARLIDKHSAAIDDGVVKGGYDPEAFRLNLTLVKKN